MVKIKIEYQGKEGQIIFPFRKDSKSSNIIWNKEKTAEDIKITGIQEDKILDLKNFFVNKREWISGSNDEENLDQWKPFKAAPVDDWSLFKLSLCILYVNTKVNFLSYL